MRAVEHAWIDPIRVFRSARGRAGRVLLDSGGPSGDLARWTALAFEPLEVFSAAVGGGTPESEGAEPLFSGLEGLFDRWRRRVGPAGDRAIGSGGDPLTSWSEDRPPFTGGVIALIGYDAGRALERLPATARNDPLLPDLWAAVYDGAAVFDRLRRRVFVTSWGARGAEGIRDLESVLRAASGSEGSRQCGPLDVDFPGAGDGRDFDPGSPRDGGGGNGRAPGQMDRGPRGAPKPRDAVDGEGLSIPGHRPDRAWFLTGVSRIKEEIARGEIYQANLTRRLAATVADSAGPSVYERLRSISPTPYGAYVDAGSFQLLSASPERFLRISRGTIETRPIKGTRPRGRTKAEDEALKAALLGSRKDRAELLMIVDLERNDLGRVCETASVRVAPFPLVEGYSNVWHLVAIVSGRLRPEVGPVGALRAAFPGGSITGAPKLRAMEILERLEPHRRKFSMGAMLAWDFGGEVDSSVLIRTLVIRSGEAIFNVGAGIVADSIAEEEYAETEAKAGPILASLELSDGQVGL